MAKQGLWANIHAKRKRIKAGSGERMRKPGSKGAPTDADFKAAQNEELDVQDSDDYKTTKSGRKVKAHRIVFNKGEDDRKGVTENMKKTYKDFVEQHTPDLTEEQKNEIVAELQEVLGKDDPAGKWISDFVHSDNPKFAGKSKEKRKQMALAAYYAKQRNEEVELDEAGPGGPLGYLSPEARAKEVARRKKALKANETPASKRFLDNAMKNIKPKSEETEIEEELKGNQHKLDKNKNGKLDKHDFKLLRKEEQDLEEALWPGTPEYKKKFDNDRVTGAGARHDIKRTSTGVVATRRFNDNDTAEKPKDQPKRGRGRPKKDSFKEAVEFLMSLDEEMFEYLTEEGFDSFIEEFEQLDEISKATLGSYAKKASADAASHSAKAQRSTAQAQDAKQRAKDPKLAFARSGNETLAKSYTKSAEKSAAKVEKRQAGVSKAIDRLTK